MTLHLTLKAKWFCMVESGDKTEEYREIKPYWIVRLVVGKVLSRGCALKPFTTIIFRNGYQKDAPTLKAEVLGLSISNGRPEWGATEGKNYFVFSLGKVVRL